MMRALLASLLLLAPLAGCLDGDNDSSKDDPATPDDGLTPGTAGYMYTGPGTLFAGPALYEDPQNTPHPAFNWPTVSTPPVGAGVPDLWKPIPAAALPEAITDLELVVQTPGVPAGAGIALFGRLAVVPGFGSPTSIVDISDPMAPKVLSQVESQIADHRGATIIAYPTGRLVTVISTDNGLDVFDITDPAAPQNLTPIDVPSHKVGVVPGTPIVYNARSDGGNGGLVPGPGNVDPSQAIGVIDLYDFSDPENVETLPVFENGYGCHHVYFWNNVTEGKYRSVCAGIEYTQIIDTADPYHPKIVVSVPYGHGLAGLPSGSLSIAAFSHYAGLSRDGTILLVGDEHGGGIGPIGCTARVDTPQGAVSVPIGAVWFYDVSDELNPQLKGWVSASELERTRPDELTDPNSITASCTAHHGRLVPYQDRDVLAMSFYGAGVIVVDFTSMRGELPALPEVVAQFADGSNTWETWYYNGYFFTGDLNRGMDVLKLV